MYYRHQMMKISLTLLIEDQRMLEDNLLILMSLTIWIFMLDSDYRKDPLLKCWKLSNTKFHIQQNSKYTQHYNSIVTR